MVWCGVKDYTNDRGGDLLDEIKRFDHIPTLAEFGLPIDDDYIIVEVKILVGDSVS